MEDEGAPPHVASSPRQVAPKKVVMTPPAPVPRPPPAPRWMFEPPGGRETTSLDKLAADMMALKSWMQRQSTATENLLVQQTRIERLLERLGDSAHWMTPSVPDSQELRQTSQEATHPDMASSVTKETSLANGKKPCCKEAPNAAASSVASANDLDSITKSDDAAIPATKTSRRSHKQEEEEERSALEKLTQSAWFDYAAALVIFLHCVFIGASVEYGATQGGKESQFLKVTNLVLVVVFFLEVCLKMAAEGRKFFTSSEKSWNIFDLFVASFIVVESLWSSIASRAQVKTAIKIAEVVRTLRILRIFRILNFSRTIKTIIAKIFHSFEMLCWVLVLLGMMVFSLAIIFTQGSNDFLYGDKSRDLEWDSEKYAVLHKFGSISRSALTLFQAISCGIFWGDVWTALLDIGEFYAALFILYVALVDFALLNIITGIFVDASLQTGMQERDLLEQKQIAKNEQCEAGLKEIFQEIDDDGNGMLSLQEFNDVVSHNEQLKVYMQALTIDVSDAKKLFKLLDRDNSGQIDSSEFLEGCKKVKGEAKSLDIHALLKDTKWLRSHIHNVNHKLDTLSSEVQDLRFEWAVHC